MIHMIEVGEFVQDDVIAQDFGYLHQTNIKRNCARRRTTAPPRGGMGQATAFIMIAIKFGVVFKAVGQVILRFFHEKFFLGVARTLGFGVAEGDFFADQGAVAIKKTFHQKVTGVLRYGHL